MQFNKYTHTHTHSPPWEDQCEWHRMTGMTGPDRAVMCNLINTHTHTHTLTGQRFSSQVPLIPPWEDQCEWHRMTRMTGPDCAVMCNLINIYTHTHTHTYRTVLRGYVQFNKYAHTHTFRHTHTSADPIRLLCIRIAVTLTLSLPSRLAPSVRLTVGVPPRALWLAEIFLHRSKTCAGIVGTR